ncbi:DNA methyltransferase [Helicobacter pylori]
MLKTPLKTLLDALINHFTKERLVTLILQHDEKLLIFMLEHENANDYKNAFFKTIANTLVFNEKALLECLETKELEKSFTRFKNKIGLFSQGGLIKSSELVVLNFPLSDDGSIYISLDYNEVHYCKVLMDEIFGVENFQREIIWRIGWLSGYKTSINNFIRNHDTILFYSKNADKLFFNKKYIENKDFKELIKIEKIQSNLDNLGIDREKQKKIIKIINHETRPERYPLEDIWNGNEYDDLNSIAIVSYSGETVSKMLGTEEIKGQKSEKLIQRILEVSTNENDLVLDFFAGSGTTCAVAHKMKRRYIGIEQMDYIETITKERLKKVIEGEQGGISKKYDFKGGGSFVYAELKEVNLKIKKQILNAKSADECLKIFNDLNERFLKRTDNKMDAIHSEEFHNLDLNEQKRIYCKLFDSNEDYLNLGDIDEDAWEIDEITKKYNEIFYS